MSQVTARNLAWHIHLSESDNGCLPVAINDQFCYRGPGDEKNDCGEKGRILHSIQHRISWEISVTVGPQTNIFLFSRKQDFVGRSFYSNLLHALCQK